QEAILQYEKEMEDKMLQNSTLPTAETDKRILKKLESLQAPVIPITSAITGKRINWLKPVAAAAVLLLGISAYFNYSLYNKNKKQEALIAASTSSPLPAGDYAVITNPSITPVAMYGVGT